MVVIKPGDPVPRRPPEILAFDDGLVRSIYLEFETIESEHAAEGFLQPITQLRLRTERRENPGRDDGCSRTETGRLRQRKKTLDVVVATLEFGVGPRQNGGEGTALEVGSTDGGIIEANDSALSVGDRG